MIFVVMLWSSLAVFDLLISLDAFTTKARKRVAKHSEQFSIFGNFIQNFCQVALRWLLFCEVPHQKPRKTTSRLPSCPLALISFFQVQEFLCFGLSIGPVGRWNCLEPHCFSKELHGSSSGGKIWSSSGWLLIFLHAMCRHSTFDRRTGRWMMTQKRRPKGLADRLQKSCDILRYFQTCCL